MENKVKKLQNCSLFCSPLSIKNRKAATALRFIIQVAESEGFEPSIPFRGIHTFQACSFNHSDNSPDSSERVANVSFHFRLNNLRAFDVVISSISFNVLAVMLANFSATSFTYVGSFRLPLKGTGAK